MRNTIKDVLGLSTQLKVNIKVVNSSYGSVTINTVELKNKDTWSGYYFSNINVPLNVSANNGYKATSVTVEGPTVYSNNTLSLKGNNEVTVIIKFDKS